MYSNSKYTPLGATSGAQPKRGDQGSSGTCLLFVIIVSFILSLANTGVVVYFLAVKSDFATKDSMGLFHKYIHPSETSPSAGSVTIGLRDSDCTAQQRLLCVQGQSNFSQTMFVGDSIIVGKDVSVSGAVSSAGRLSGNTGVHSPYSIETPNQVTALWRVSASQVNAINDDGFKKNNAPANLTELLAFVNSLAVERFEWDTAISRSNFKLPVTGIQLGLSSDSVLATGESGFLSSDVINVDQAMQRTSTGTVSQLKAVDLSQIVAALVGAIQEITTKLP